MSIDEEKSDFMAECAYPIPAWRARLDEADRHEYDSALVDLAQRWDSGPFAEALKLYPHLALGDQHDQPKDPLLRQLVLRFGERVADVDIVRAYCILERIEDRLGEIAEEQTNSKDSQPRA